MSTYIIVRSVGANTKSKWYYTGASGVMEWNNQIEKAKLYTNKEWAMEVARSLRRDMSTGMYCDVLHVEPVRSRKLSRWVAGLSVGMFAGLTVACSIAFWLLMGVSMELVSVPSTLSVWAGVGLLIGCCSLLSWWCVCLTLFISGRMKKVDN